MSILCSPTSTVKNFIFIRKKNAIRFYPICAALIIETYICRNLLLVSPKYNTMKIIILLIIVF